MPHGDDNRPLEAMNEEARAGVRAMSDRIADQLAELMPEGLYFALLLYTPDAGGYSVLTGNDGPNKTLAALIDCAENLASSLRQKEDPNVRS